MLQHRALVAAHSAQRGGALIDLCDQPLRLPDLDGIVLLEFARPVDRLFIIAARDDEQRTHAVALLVDFVQPIFRHGPFTQSSRSGAYADQERLAVIFWTHSGDIRATRVWARNCSSSIPEPSSVKGVGVVDYRGGDFHAQY